jgi:predicted Zn finger-like uncharacterized protein
MRLICPNCSAEYEVDVSVIPPNGRDVQCSNCANAWFEPHPDQAKATATATGQAPKPRRPQRAQPEINIHRADDTAQTPARRSRVAAQRASRGSETPAELPEEPPLAAIPQRREIDPDVLRVLREEAAHDARARRGEPMESQEELALAGAAPRQSRRTPTDPRDLPDEDLVPSGTIGPRRVSRDGGARSETLPDIEQINSSLRASTDRKTSIPAYVEVEQRLKKVRRGQGFRLGFSLMLLIAAAGIFGYVFAPEISERFPQAKPYLTAFTTEVNSARGWLDTTIRGLSEQITQLVANNS